MSRIFFWRRIPLRVQGLLFNSLPLLAVLLTAVFAFFSNQQRERTELSLNRHFEMVENLIDLHTALLNAEAGLRGYLLTRSPAFLQPYAAARDLIPQKLARVRTLMESIPKPARRTEKLARFDAVQNQVNAQLTAFAALPITAEQPALPETDVSAQIVRHQPLLEAAGRQLADLRANEQRLLGRRLDEIRSVRQRDYLLIFLSVLVGLVSRAVALYFFHRRVIRRVRQLTENVRSLRDGSALVHEPSDNADDIGELERELARIGDFLAERRVDS
jgi:CHASE3 domain sensor protein